MREPTGIAEFLRARGIEPPAAIRDHEEYEAWVAMGEAWGRRLATPALRALLYAGMFRAGRRNRPGTAIAFGVLLINDRLIDVHRAVKTLRAEEDQ